MADEAPHWTPFRFCFNNPLTVIDPTGMSEVSDRIGGGLDFSDAVEGDPKKDKGKDKGKGKSNDDPFQKQKYTKYTTQRDNTVIYKPGSYELSPEKTADLAQPTNAH